MSDCKTNGTWSHETPAVSGVYEVRPCPTAWNIGPDTPYKSPAAKLTYVDAAAGRFDAGKFGGDIADPVWEWRGPIQAPETLPEGW